MSEILGISGLGTEGFFGVLFYLLYKDLIRPKYDRWKEKNGKFKTRTKNNPSGIPGFTKECLGNRDKIVKVTQAVEDLTTKVAENKVDAEKNFDTIYRKIDKIITGGK